ncbi:coenzyme Q-binding protein COQ10 homolog, mitochondrial [Neosynchiropus ocellatus]
MAKKTVPLLFRTLLEVSEESLPKIVRGNFRRAKSGNSRTLGASVAVAPKRMTAPLSPVPANPSCSRGFINLAAAASSRRMEYTECRTLRYAPEQLYGIVADVDQYQRFVPWCKRSRVTRRQNGSIQAELEIGFPPVVERYTSDVTVVPNHLVRAVCTNGTLFSHLETIWRFAPGPGSTPDSCKVHFHVSFEFRSLLHSQLASVFFDEVVKQMVSAFERRAASQFKHQQGETLSRQST